MSYEVISFDCYGTLVDWKQGVLNELVPLFEDFQLEISEEEIFSLFLELDSELESNDYQDYKGILKSIMKAFSSRLSLNLLDEDLLILSNSLPQWPLFPDTVECLSLLKEKYKLAIISNIDNDLFEKTNRQLGIEFDYIITAENLQTYKPSHNNFSSAIDIMGVKKENVLHCAQSYYHDIEPSTQLGINNVWLNRYSDKLPEDSTLQPDQSFHTLFDLIDFLK